MSDFLHHLPEFASNHMLLVLMFLMLLVVIVSHEFSRFFRGYKELTPAALTLLINRESPLLVDLSSLQDYEKAHIPGAKHVPMSQFDPENKDLAKVKAMPVAVYCKSGTTSAQAAARLVKAGFQKVFWLGGGLASWQQADLPLVRGK